jgi:hypothetical protein
MQPSGVFAGQGAHLTARKRLAREVNRRLNEMNADQ